MDTKITITDIINRISDSSPDGFWIKQAAICAIHIVSDKKGQMEFTRIELQEAVDRYCGEGPNRRHLIECVSSFSSSVQAYGREPAIDPVASA